MTIYHWICLGGFAVCLLSCLYHFFRVASGGIPNDHAVAKGKIGPAVSYSFTKGMSPMKKETAYLHLPTYIAGILFHIGTFLGLFWLILIFFDLEINRWITYISAAYLAISAIAGISILIKRLASKKMRGLSNPDDYISNLLVCSFQALIALCIFDKSLVPFLLVLAAFLFVYIPISKLKHTIYFFTSRFHLGVFYGRRGTWPVKKQNI